MSFHVSEAKEWVSQYKNIWNKVESQSFEKLVTEMIKGGGRYIHGKLKTWKEHIKINFHGQDVPQDMYCNVKIKQGKNYHPQVYVEDCKYTNAENQQCRMLSDDDDGFFDV